MKAVVVSLVAAVSLMMAAHNASADCLETINLSPPSEAEQVAAIGGAEVRSQTASERAGEQQAFTVAVGLDVPDGTSLFVFANGEPAGTMTVAGGVGRLELSNADGARLPAGVDPVCGIGPVWVTDADGTTLLAGSF